MKSILGPAAAAIGTVAIGGLIKSSVDLEARFGKTMSLVAASTGAPKSAIAGLRAEAMKLGASTKFSANEAADAMLELGKAGISTSDIMGGALKGTLLLAAAGDTDLATATTIASNAMNTFNLRGKDMNSIAAALAGGANASSASVASLGEALGQVGPGATNAGLSLQETVGVLSAFDAAGVKGSDAGTSLKTMLASLVPQTKKSAAAMAALGLKFTDSQGKFLPITNVAGQLKKALGGLSEAQRTTALTTIFGSDASRAATVLMKEGAGGIAKYIKATRDQGAAEKLAKANMSGTAGALERMSGAIETAQLALGTALAPTVVKVANYLSTTLIPALTKIPVVVAQFQTYLAPALAFFQGLINGSGQSSAKIDGLRATVSTALASIKSIFASNVSIITSLWGAFGGTITTYLRNTMTNVLTVLRGAFNVIAGIFKVVSSLLKGDWRGVWDGIKQILRGALTVIQGLLKQGMNTAKAILSAAGTAIKAAAKGAFNGIKDGAQAAWASAKGYIAGLPGKIVAMFASLGADMLGVGGHIIDGLVNGIRAGVGRVVDAAKSVANAIPGPIKKILHINSPSKITHAIGLGVGEGLTNGIHASTLSVASAASGLGASVLAGLQDGSSGLSAYMSGLNKTITDSLVSKKANLKKAKPGASKKQRAAVSAFNDRERKNVAKYNDAARAAIKSQKAAVDQLGKSLSALAGKIDTARGDLKSLQDARASLADQTASGISGELDLTETKGRKLSFATVAANVSGLAARAKAFAGKLRGLLAAGIPAGLVQEVASLGTVQGSSVADALLSGSQQQIGQLAEDYKGIDTYSKQIGDIVAGSMYDAGIAAQQGILAGLLDDAAIQASADQLAKKLTKAVKKALGIKSPSKVFQNEVGKYLPAGIAAGIDDGQRALDRRVQGMVNVSRIGTVSPGDFGAGVAASASPTEQHFHVTAPAGTNEPELANLLAARMMFKMTS